MRRECDPVEGSSGAELASKRTEPHHAVQAKTTRGISVTKQDELPCNQTVEFWCERDLVYGMVMMMVFSACILISASCRPLHNKRTTRVTKMQSILQYKLVSSNDCMY